MRIAIVGCGPKGLFALERLLAHTTADPGRAIDIELFEPNPTLGAGPVYEPDQPDYLLMNFSSRRVDMWWRGDGPVTPGDRPTFAQWRGDPADDYAPRASVGRYLADGLRSLVESAPDGVTIGVHDRGVEAVRPAGDRWALRGDGWTTEDFDRVLLTTGHEQLRPGSVTTDTSVPAEGTIAIRGFALTFIDAALSLTEGRGGRFAEAENGRLSYIGTGEPIRIVPFSRTGRPMLAKPSHGPGDEALEARGTALLNALPAPVTDLSGELLPLLAGLLRPEHRERGGEWLAHTVVPASGSTATDDEVGADLGRVWRAVYPAIVRRLSGNGIADGEWPAFRRLSAELERLSFGPPPVNAAKLDALVAAGIVDLGSLTRVTPDADVVVDAVMPQPGVPERGLLRDLVDDGFARVPPGRRGLETSATCECIGEDGLPSRGLAAYGRPTEDWVIGNDTLSRSLHPQIDAWAEAVLTSDRPAVHA